MDCSIVADILWIRLDPFDRDDKFVTFPPRLESEFIRNERGEKDKWRSDRDRLENNRSLESEKTTYIRRDLVEKKLIVAIKDRNRSFSIVILR